MRKKINYIYYRFYRFQVSVGNGDVALSLSLIFLSFLIMLNFLTVGFVLYAFVGVKLQFGNPFIEGPLIIGIITMINYFLFVHKKKYKAIIKTYKNETKNEIKKGNIMVLIYILLSFIMIGVGFWLMIMRNRMLL